jgi:Leucine-rich repeat (LRR) protein
MRRSNWITVVLLCFAACAGAEQADSRVIRFPSDRSMGTLYVLDSNRVDTSRYDSWELLCEASGKVQVPAGKVLKLYLSKEAGDDLSPLSALRPDDLITLYCFGVEIADEQLQHISHLTGLEEINLHSTNILGTGLKYLVKLKKLEGLSLNSTHVGDNELAYLSDLPSLKSLDLWGTPVNDAGMVHLGKIVSLKTIRLSKGVGDEGLSHLKNLTSLRHLSVSDPSISDKGISHLSGMTQMEYLYIADTQISNEGLLQLKQMKKLKELHLWQTRVTEEGLINLKGLTKLEQLRLGFPFTEAGLVHLSGLASLKHVRLDESSMTPKGLDILSEMKSLEDVIIDCGRKGGSHNTDAVVKKLTGSLKLKSLSICEGLTDEGLAYLTNIQSLEKLDIFRSQVTGMSIAVLAELPCLKELSLVEPTLTSEAWAAIGKLCSLECLYLNFIQSKFTDADIAHLSGLYRLQRLIIYPNIPDEDGDISLGITEKSLMHISKLKALESLGLASAKITNEGLQHLAKLSALKHISFERCKVSEQDLQQLKKKLPALRWSIY